MEVRRQSPNSLLTDEGVSNVAHTLRESETGTDTVMGEDDVVSMATLDSCRHGSRSMDAFARPYVKPVYCSVCDLLSGQCRIRIAV